MMPCLNEPQDIVVANPDPELRDILVRERDRMDERMAFLEHNRESLTRYIAAMDATVSQQKLKM